MKRELISKIIAGTVILTTLGSLVPIRASADWVNDYQGNWYYMQDNERLTGWKKIDGQLYYFDNNGKMQTGWIKAGSSWYFLQNNGALKTGWINYNKKWYYADNSGAIQKGVININGKIYVFDDNGAMKTSNAVINGEFYTIGANGEVVGFKAPTPDKEFDGAGNCVQVLKNNSNDTISSSPTTSNFNQTIEDQSVSDDDPNEGRIFKVSFKDSNGKDLKAQNVKNGKSIDLYEPTRDGYVFKEWNTKSDGSGKSYSSSDDIKVKENINLYAQWSEDTNIYASEIKIKGGTYVTVNKTIQLTAEISPSEATNKSVTWSVTDGSGKATIDSNGVLTGVSAGTVTVKATANDLSKVSVTKEITVSASDVSVPVERIEVTSETGVYTISKDKGTLKMNATVYPDSANDQDVTWTVINTGGSAAIDPKTGLVSAISDGPVQVVATSANGVFGSKIIEISGQSIKIPVKTITVSGKGGATSIDTDAALGGTNGTLQMIADITPVEATNKTVTWSVVPYSDGTTTAGAASISAGGLLTALRDGTVMVKAVSKDNTSISGEAQITITKQSVRTTSFDVQGEGGNTINTNGGTLKMGIANVQPSNGDYKTIAWSVSSAAGSVGKVGSASISDNGNGTATLKAITDGDVLVKAVLTNKDGTQVTKTATVSISGQSTAVNITGIEVVGQGGATSINTDNGTLQMKLNLLPYNQNVVTTPAGVTWSVINGPGSATIDSSGILTAVGNGNVEVDASYNDGTTTFTGKTNIYISGQYREIKNIYVNSAYDRVELDGSLQMTATIDPSNAEKVNIIWKAQSGTGTANITKGGLLTGTSLGTVTVMAVDALNDKTIGTKVITVVKPVPITGIDLHAPAIGYDTITTTGGAVNITANITPNPNAADGATNPGLTWTCQPYGGLSGTEQQGSADLVDNGDGTVKVTAKTNGWVKVTATAKDGSGKFGEYPIKISGQFVKVTGITVTAPTTTMQVLGGTLQMTATVNPSDASVQGVTWSVSSSGGQAASIDSNTGILTAKTKGTAYVKATTKEANSTISGTLQINIIPIDKIVVKSVTGATTMTSGGSLQFAATITPVNVPNQTVTWSVQNLTGQATIDPDKGILTASSAGTVEVKATSTVDPTKFANILITIS